MDRGEDCPSLLVVDDDAAFCRTLKRVMERRGFTVTIAHSVAQALWTAQESLPEFVLLDLKMPGPSGLTLIERLKQVDPETRIVVLTGYASIATAIEAIKLGALHYLAKPATADVKYRRPSNVTKVIRIRRPSLIPFPLKGSNESTSSASLPKAAAISRVDGLQAKNAPSDPPAQIGQAPCPRIIEDKPARRWVGSRRRHHSPPGRVKIIPAGGCR